MAGIWQHRLQKPAKTHGSNLLSWMQKCRVTHLTSRKFLQCKSSFEFPVSSSCYSVTLPKIHPFKSQPFPICTAKHSPCMRRKGGEVLAITAESWRRCLLDDRFVMKGWKSSVAQCLACCFHHKLLATQRRRESSDYYWSHLRLHTRQYSFLLWAL